MPVYDIQNQYQQQNVNYTNRDFNDLKRALINYTKAYYPNAYKDFNETSPGMMLLELSAYTGDVLNYYVDNHTVRNTTEDIYKSKENKNKEVRFDLII